MPQKYRKVAAKRGIAAMELPNLSKKEQLSNLNIIWYIANARQQRQYFTDIYNKRII
jgi:hypothetical protein